MGGGGGGGGISSLYLKSALNSSNMFTHCMTAHFAFCFVFVYYIGFLILRLGLWSPLTAAHFVFCFVLFFVLVCIMDNI